jgi:hypothetical protein
MASQTEPVTTTDVLDYIGELFFYGQTMGKAPLLTLKGLGQARKATASNFPMGTFVTGDAPAQDGLSEDDQIAAGSYTSYTGTQTTQYVQAMLYRYAVSYAAQALGSTISGLAIANMPLVGLRTMPVQRRAHMAQLMADWEYSALRGTSAAWTNASTAGKMGGLVTAIKAGSETAAGGAALSKSLIDTELIRMEAAGAEFGDVVFAAGAFQLVALNNLYGNAIQSTTQGGTNITTLAHPIVGEVRIVKDPILAADDLLIVDMNHFFPVFGTVPGKPNVSIEPLAKVGAADYEMIYALTSVDYNNIIYHGMVSGLATS